MPRDMTMPQPDWTLSYAALMFAMWWLMMTAMMLLSATPIPLLRLRSIAARSPRLPTLRCDSMFACGYLAAWAFSVVAAAQACQRTAPVLDAARRRGASQVLLLAGIWR
jgi:predicted metal-binding membrane protein